MGKPESNDSVSKYLLNAGDDSFFERKVHVMKLETGGKCSIDAL